MTFSLRENDSIPTDGSGRVLITDISYKGDYHLICRSERNVSSGGDWFLHPTEMSTDDDDRIDPNRVSRPILIGYHIITALTSESIYIHTTSCNT